jgi:hypothetical protein
MYQSITRGWEIKMESKLNDLFASCPDKVMFVREGIEESECVEVIEGEEMYALLRYALIGCKLSKLWTPNYSCPVEYALKSPVHEVYYDKYCILREVCNLVLQAKEQDNEGV